jgi:3-hydroxyisobutyrate dehydrogenase-like beta-hydroxyacid dehydrogenase
VFDNNGIVKNATEKTIIIDLSTTLVNETIKFSEKFKHKTGGVWIDAPVSGGPEKALDGTLSIMVGGNKKDINIISHLLDIISKKFTCFGPTGSGQVVKMINQILVLNNYTILAEALSFAKAWGIDAKEIPDALNDGHAGSNLLMTLFPRMINNDFEPQGYTSQILKDLKMLSQLAEEKNVPIPMSTLSKQLFTIHANKSKQNLDGISIVKLFDKNKKI